MKTHLLLLLLAACLSGTAMAQSVPGKVKPMSEKAKAAAPRFLFTGGDTKQIGNVSDQESVVFTFEFTNVGKKPLIITKATGSCGCTVPEVPKAPIMPGAKGEIKVTFNPAGKAGPIMKTIYIVSNALSNMEEGPYQINISGAVVPGLPLNHPPGKSN